MTDREFWKKLDEISRQEMSAMRELSFQSLLKQGYEENRGILIACFFDQKFPGMAKQAYIELDGERLAAGLLFNPYCENMMIVPKPLLEILMPGDKEKPPFYREPKQ